MFDATWTPRTYCYLLRILYIWTQRLRLKYNTPLFKMVMDYIHQIWTQIKCVCWLAPTTNKKLHNTQMNHSNRDSKCTFVRVIPASLLPISSFDSLTVKQKRRNTKQTTTSYWLLSHKLKEWENTRQHPIDYFLINSSIGRTLGSLPPGAGVHSPQSNTPGDQRMRATSTVPVWFS